jgi:hypothetical protein
MYDITHPPLRTYYIISTVGVVVGAGFVDPEQCMSSGADTMETFTDELAFQTRLAELGGVPEEQ